MTPKRRKKRLISEVGLDAALGQKPIAQRLQRDVGLLPDKPSRKARCGSNLTRL